MDSIHPIRVAIVGCGYQGRLLAQAIGRLDTLFVTACADPVREAAVSVATAAGHSNIYGSVDELLRSSDVDAIVIATPHHLLAEIALSAIKAGKHVLAEKPIAVSEQEAHRIEEALVTSDIRYMAGYSLRFFAAQQQVYNLLRMGAVGKIEAITAGIGMQPLTGWRNDPTLGGGQLLYLGSHLIDEVLWYLGEDPVAVYADVRDRADSHTDETSLFQIHFANGAVAQCMVTQAVDGWFDYIDIYGREGHVSLTSSSWLQYEITVSSNRLQTYNQPTRIYPRLVDDPIIMMLVPEVEEFAAAIIDHRQPCVIVADGRRVLKVLDAVKESSQLGRPVNLGANH